MELLFLYDRQPILPYHSVPLLFSADFASGSILAEVASSREHILRYCGTGAADAAGLPGVESGIRLLSHRAGRGRRMGVRSLSGRLLPVGAWEN